MVTSGIPIIKARGRSLETRGAWQGKLCSCSSLSCIALYLYCIVYLGASVLFTQGLILRPIQSQMQTNILLQCPVVLFSALSFFLSALSFFQRPVIFREPFGLSSVLVWACSCRKRPIKAKGGMIFLHHVVIRVGHRCHLGFTMNINLCKLVRPVVFQDLLEHCCRSNSCDHNFHGSHKVVTSLYLNIIPRWEMQLNLFSNFVPYHTKQEAKICNRKYSWTSPFCTRLIRNPCYFEVKLICLCLMLDAKLSYFKSSLFWTYFHAPWNFEIAGFDCTAKLWTVIWNFPLQEILQNTQSSTK